MTAFLRLLIITSLKKHTILIVATLSNNLKYREIHFNSKVLLITLDYHHRSNMVKASFILFKTSCIMAIFIGRCIEQ
jgi:hypothetical protein